ncbi:MAG: endonuclease/exonuclease/phosphatase family protein [Ignavibacteriae bacterium]|nr:endonuclease/exonuclease/phosphatase family protein [Ignavibacteriota bacterium]
MKLNNLKNIVVIFNFLLLTFILTGCPPKEIKREETTQPPPPPPLTKKPLVQELTFRTASFDLKTLSKKIERKDVVKTAALLKKEKVDIVAVQQVVRYPEIKDRTDTFEELAKEMGMYKAFGENITLSGRQTGNALFSSYPIRSHDNITYSGLKSYNFESALIGIIDLGISNVITVCTRIPDKASEADEARCLNSLMVSKRSLDDAPMLLFGNITKPKQFEKIVDVTEPFEYNIVTHEQKSETQKFPFWYSSGEIHLLQSYVRESELGLILIAEFQLISKPTP